MKLSFEGSLKETKTVAVCEEALSTPSTFHSLLKLPQYKLTGPATLNCPLFFVVYFLLLNLFTSNKGVFLNIVHATQICFAVAWRQAYGEELPKLNRKQIGEDYVLREQENTTSH